MALPVTISGVGWSEFSHFDCRPMISSAGNVYVVLLDSAAKTTIEVWKATDPTSSFSEADSANKPVLANIAKSIAAVQAGDVIHIVSQEGTTGLVTYHTFNMATDQWVVVKETAASPATVPGFFAVRVTIRSDGDVIALYHGAKDTITMSTWDRVKYARREPIVDPPYYQWTVNVTVGNAALEGHEVVGAAVRGASDRVHFFFSEYTIHDDAFQRTLTNANSLETLPAAFDTAIDISSSTLHFGPGVAYESGGATKVRAPYKDSTGLVSIAQMDSADTPTVSINADATASAVYEIRQQSLSQCLAKGTTLYLVWVAGSTFDLMYDSNADGAGWGTDQSLYNDAATIDGFCASIFVRGGNYKLAYVVRTATPEIKYNELDLGAAAVFMPRQGLTVQQAVNRAATY